MKARVAEALDRCLLGEVAGRRIENLSKGFRQRTALAGALVHQPPVLILDEPTIGLDPVQIIKIRETIRELGKDRSVLLSTHILPEVEAVCDRVLIIDRGRIVAEGTPSELRSKLAGTPVVRAVFRGAVDGARGARRAARSVGGRSRSGPRGDAGAADLPPGLATRVRTSSVSRSRRAGCFGSSRARRCRSRTCSCG